MQINESFGYLINMTARNVKKELEERIKEYDITSSQWAVLKVLSEERAFTQAEVAKKLSADRATTGSVIDRLLDKKLISRNQCENDRRANKVSLTEYGLELTKKICMEAIECNKKALAGFDDKDIQKFIWFLNKINSNMNRGESNVMEIRDI